MAMVKQKSASKKTVKAFFEIRYVPLPSELEPAWRASLLSLLNLLKGEVSNELHQRAPDRSAFDILVDE